MSHTHKGLHLIGRHHLLEDPCRIYCHFSAVAGSRWSLATLLLNDDLPRLSLQLLARHWCERLFKGRSVVVESTCCAISTWHVTKNGGPFDRVILGALKVLIGPWGLLNSLHVSQISLTWQVPICDQVNGMAWKWKYLPVPNNDFCDTAPSFDRIAAAFCEFASRLLQPASPGKKGRKPGWFLWVYPLLIKHNWLWNSPFFQSEIY